MPGTIPNVRILGSSRSRGGYFGPSCRLPVPIITSAGESGGFLDWSFEREAAVLAFVGETDKEGGVGDGPRAEVKLGISRVECKY